ncbi:MAG: hypothetical protein G01um101420_254 [Parcubacteria group bacterium Gr01-1014_20]|nr:MAG: hypothetical protein G01um101420_254 [Parcubacteria group bacterium Gr01-1014_20]
MTKNSLIIGGIVVVVLVVVFFAMGGYSTSDNTDGDSMESKSEVSVTLSTQNASGISGTATISDVDGKAKVVLSLTGAPAEISEPAHIHIGSCAEIGAVKYPLISVLGGVSETILEVSTETLLGSLPLAINVHKSAEEVSVYVACGDLLASLAE